MQREPVVSRRALRPAQTSPSGAHLRVRACGARAPAPPVSVSVSVSRGCEAARLGSSGKALGRELRRGRWASAGAQRGGRGGGAGEPAASAPRRLRPAVLPPFPAHSLQPLLHVSGYHAAAERVSGAAVPPRRMRAELGGVGAGPALAGTLLSPS